MNKKFGVEYHLVDSCNLRCAGCSHYSSLPDHLIYTPLDKIKNEIVLLKSKTDSASKLDWIRLLGGEPLLHPQVTDCINIIRKLLPTTQITLVTNGLILEKMSSDFYQTCCNCNIEILVTNYYVIDIEKVFDYVKSKGVTIDIYRSCNKWYYQNIRLTKDRVNCFDNCYHKTMCPNYRNGYIYLCPQMAYIDIFNSSFEKCIPIQEDERINLNKIYSFEDLLNSYNSLRPEFCFTYCNCRGEDGNSIIEGPRRTTKKEINEFCLC